MGRVKLQMKRIESASNRQVTFSKRKNGLIKKAYELSVLCDVDVALIIYSPSGRLSLFSGNKSIEEILARYVNVRERDQGRQHIQEFLKREVCKLRSTGAEHQNPQTTSPISSNSQREEIQQVVLCFRSQLKEMENLLRIFEGDPAEFTTVHEADYREQILLETLKNVCLRKNDLLQQRPGTANVDQELAAASSSTPQIILDHFWLQRSDPQMQMLNCFDENGHLSLGYGTQRGIEMVTPGSRSSGLIMNGQEMNNDFEDDHITPRSGLGNDSNMDNNNNAPPSQFAEQLIDVSWPPSWCQFYSNGE